MLTTYMLKDMAALIWMLTTYMICLPRIGVYQVIQLQPAAMMHESRRQPMKHAWCKQVITWWNIVAKQLAADLVMQAMALNIHMSVSAGSSHNLWSCTFNCMAQLVDLILTTTVQITA